MKGAKPQFSCRQTGKFSSLLLAFGVLLGGWASSARGELGESRIFSVVPPGDHVCVAVQIEHSPSEALSGLSWLNNDDTVQFPRLLLMEATEGVAPDLNDTGLILYDLSAEDLDWGEVQLGTAVQSTTGLLYAVFVFPEDTETTGIGSGGGPGIGVDDVENGVPFYISHDGLEWVQFSTNYQLAIEPEFTGASKHGGGARTLASLAEGLDYWGQLEEDPELPAVEKTVLRPIAPNPFNPRTTIAFDLAQPGKVKIHLYDVRGRLVRTLADTEYPAGRWTLRWEGTDDRDQAVASGVYYLQMQADGQSFRSKLVLVR